MVRELKEKYNHRCQICGLQLYKGNGEYYSEGHHLRPLGREHFGVDDEDNIIILCPNHHTEFDYGVIAIDPKTKRIIHVDPKNEFHDKNLVNKRNLKNDYLIYHLENVFVTR